MKISLSQLKAIIREVVEETSIDEAEKEEDLNKDGKNDFKDVMIARMKASGMKHDKAVEKGQKVATAAQKKKQ